MFGVKHGGYKTRLYRIWKNMKYRCSNPNSPAYKDYGARGICVCAEWQKYEQFRDWSMANGYKDNLTIDRIDNDKGYSPDNCRWATMKTQSNNSRMNRTVEFDGSSHTLTEWAEITGICVATLWDRLKSGWNVERALTEPVHNNGRNKGPHCGARMEG